MRTSRLALVIGFVVAASGGPAAAGCLDLIALTPEELHDIAWTAGRAEFNRKAAAGELALEPGTTVEPLGEDHFTEPDGVGEEPGVIRVYYGAAAGPWIAVAINPSGRVLAVEAAFVNR